MLEKHQYHNCGIRWFLRLGCTVDFNTFPGAGTIVLLHAVLSCDSKSLRADYFDSRVSSGFNPFKPHHPPVAGGGGRAGDWDRRLARQTNFLQLCRDETCGKMKTLKVDDRLLLFYTVIAHGSCGDGGVDG